MREYQRGHYLTAFKEATRRVEEKSDPKAMTLLGELYADGLALPNDDKKAAEWYKLAAARGDREAMFALAHVQHRRPRRSAPTARRRRGCWPRPPSSAMSSRPTISRCSISKASSFPQDFARAAELFRMAADAGNPEAQYALATFYKEGRGVTKDLNEAARLLGAAARAGHTDAEVEYAIALFNGTGVAKNESAAAGYFLKAARKGNPVAQNRLALHVRHRPRHQGRPGRGRALAPDRQGRRRQRPVPRRIRAQDEARRIAPWPKTRPSPGSRA